MSSNSVVTEKYRRALLIIHQLEQERNEIKEDYENLVKDGSVTQKLTRDLCMAILNKTEPIRRLREKKEEREDEENGRKRDKSKKKEEPVYSKMKLEDLVRKAQEGLEEYTVYNSEVHKALQDTIEHGVDKIKELKKDLDDKEEELGTEKKNHGEDVEKTKREYESIISQLGKKMQTGAVEKEELEKIIGNVLSGETEDFDLSINEEVVIETEPEDGVGKDVSQAVSYAVENGENVVTPAGGPKVNVDQKSLDEVKKEVKNAEKEAADEIGRHVSMMSDTQKLMLRAMGESGKSEFEEIFSYASEHFDGLPAKTTVRGALTDMAQTGKDDGIKNALIKVTQIPLPGHPKQCLYEMSKTGEAVYRFLFKKDPALSEMRLLIKEHDNIKHGYGIKYTAELIAGMPYMKKIGADVRYLEGRKFAEDTGDGTSYEPDIVILYTSNGKERKEYIEYETGDSPDKDLFVKIRKMGKVGRRVNIVAPDNPGLQSTVSKLGRWKSRLKEKPSLFPENRDKIVIRYCTYGQIRSQKEGKPIPWTETEVQNPNMKAKKET